MTGIADRFDDGWIGPILLELIDDAAAGPLTMLLALAVAAGVGALHALGPGHGKLLISGYLASTQGRPHDALALGGVVAAMHTGSVLLLGLLFHTTTWIPDGRLLGAILTLVTAAAVTSVGAVIVARQLRQLRARRSLPSRSILSRSRVDGSAEGAPDSPPSRSVHPTAGAHQHHLPPGAQPLSRAGITALAASGGLLPSPAAFAVLITALAIDRTGYGLALVGAFSVGLAATLAAVGLTVLSGRDRVVRHLDHHPRRVALASAVPMLGGLTVVVGGLVLTWTSIASM